MRGQRYTVRREKKIDPHGGKRFARPDEGNFWFHNDADVCFTVFIYLFRIIYYGFG